MSTEQAPNVEGAEAPSVSLQDLAMVLNVLNVAIKRGAYEPNELATVGQVYGKLEAFLQAQAQAAEGQASADEPTEGEAE